MGKVTERRRGTDPFSVRRRGVGVCSFVWAPSWCQSEKRALPFKRHADILRLLLVTILQSLGGYHPCPHVGQSVSVRLTGWRMAVLNTSELQQ